MGAAAPAERYAWCDAYALGHGSMDDTHREFVAHVDALMRVHDSGFLSALDAFVAHTEAHFAQESTWMADSGFPPVGCHEAEHRNVLETAVAVRERVAAGDVALGRQLVAALAEWFPQHAATMDRMLAGWLAR